LHYRQVGPPHGAPLLLLHQTPSSSLEFLPFMQEMSKDRRVIAFDTPGFGMSDAPPAPLSMADYAAAFADALGDQRVDVLGHHTGAYLAAELALARPDLVGRVIMVAIPFRPAEERAAKLAGMAPAAADEAALRAFVSTMWDYTVAARHADMPLARALALFAERIRPMQRANWPYEGVWRYDAEARFAQLTQPVLVLQPHEPLFPHWRHAVAMLANAEIFEFADLNKDIFDVGVARLAAAVRGWLA
jgi:pimeloyl-ACP methyl ester carboxylesterase